MERRKFLQHSGLAGILAAGSAPAFAQGAGEVKWRLASSFPKSLDTIYGGALTISTRVAAATNNKFQIQVFAGGEHLDLKFVVAHLRDALAEIFAAAVERIERLRPARRHAPFDFRHRLRDRRRGDSGRGRESHAGRFQELTTFHCVSPL